VFAPRDPDEYLLDTERRVIRVRRHWTCLMWDIVEALALLAGAVVISMLLPRNGVVQNVVWYAALFVVLRFAYTVIEWWVERLVVTDKRFLICRGVFTSQVAMMPITKVTDLTYERSLTGRLLGYGTLIVESAGQIQGLDRIDHLPQPERVYDAISELVFGDPKARQERFSMLKARRAALGKRPAP
jgi:uncharacterized membrane protein YdbT with pleckstrin-like domain